MLFAVALLSLVSSPLQRPDSTVVLTGGKYLDVRAGVLRDNGAIVLRGGRIAEMHPPGKRWTVPLGATVKSAEGQTIIPGLIDAHVHLTLAGDYAENARTTLAAGFTTVADLGSIDGAAIKLRDDINAGRLPGPRIITAGSWIGTRDGVCEFGKATITMAEEAIARVKGDITAGADLIKLCVTGWPIDAVNYPDSVEFKAPLVNAVLPIAKASRRPVFAHAIGQAGALLAASSGVRALAHTPVVDSVAAATIARSGIYLISTLTTLSQGDGGEEIQQSFQRLRRAGIRIVLGTDGGVLPHGRNAEELATLVQAGLTPLEALRAATLTAAELLDRKDLGEIAVGRAADLVLVSGDPLVDVALLRSPVLVFHDGRPVTPSGFR